MESIRKILLVEDDIDDLMFFDWALTLVAPNTECVKAKNGDDCIKILTEINGFPDLVFLDLNIPLKNGFECLKLIRENDLIPYVPVIIYSNSYNEDDIAKSKELGAAGYFRKPNDIKNLLSILKSIFSVDYNKPDNFFVF